jgi:drug/metabolite transporter (DMT)-like permease
MKAMTIILVLATNVSFAASSVFFKVAVDKIGKFDFSSIKVFLPIAGRFISSPPFFGGVGAAIIGSACYYIMLSRMSLSIAYPLLSLAYIFVAVASMLFLKETVALPTWIGILCICIGVALVSMEAR